MGKKDRTETQVNLRIEGCELEVVKVMTLPFSYRDAGRPLRTRVYFSPDGETVLENFLGGRHNRPYSEFRKVLPAVLGIAGLRPQKASWSRKAGCSMCPCSPGFVHEDRATFGGEVPTAVYVTYRIVEPDLMDQGGGKSLGCHGCDGTFLTPDEVDAHEEETGHGS